MFKNKSNEETIEQIVNLMRRDRFGEDAPTNAIRAAKNIFRQRLPEPKSSFAQKVRAVLQFDSFADKPLLAERSTSKQTRQLFFEAGDNGLDLRIAPGKKHLDLHGQVVGANFANCTVKIQSENRVFEQRANEISEFKFANIPRGRYDLILQANENEIVVEELQLD